MNTTHLAVLFPDTGALICLLDHDYCDGLILFDLFTHLFDEIRTLKLPFTTYRYIPIVTDLLASEWTTRVAHDTLRCPSFITQYHDKSHIFSRVINRRDSPIWNRWANYAMNVLPVFECTDALHYVRVALSVGI